MQPNVTAKCVIGQLVYCVDVILCLAYACLSYSTVQYQQRLKMYIKHHENSQGKVKLKETLLTHLHVNTYQPFSLILRGIEGAWSVLHTILCQECLVSFK